MKVNEIIGTTAERVCPLEVIRGESGATIFAASLSSELPVRQMFGEEILEHTADAVDLTRAATGLALLFNHDINTPIGRVDNISLDAEKRQLRGIIEFDSDDPAGERLRAKVEKGHLSDVSIRYQIHDAVPTDTKGGIRITKWTPTEVSLVTVPADHTVGIGRTLNTDAASISTSQQLPELIKMDTTKTNDDKVVDFTAALDAGRAEGTTTGITTERARISEIESLFSACRFGGSEYDALRRDCIDKGSSVTQTSAAIMALMNREPDEQTASRGEGNAQTAAPTVTAGDDQLDKFDEGVRTAIEMRVGLLDADARRAAASKNEFVGIDMVGIAREYCRRSNIGLAGASREDIIGYAFRPDTAPGGRRDLVGIATGDLTNILANTAEKSLMRGYAEAPETWQQWTRQTDLADFKVADRAGMSEAESLLVVPEGGEYTHGSQADRKETIQGLKYGRLIAFTREAMINDDLNTIGETPRRMGRAASRTVGDIVYAILTTPPTMNQDATALFRASNTGTGAPPSVTTLDEMRQLMALQTDSSSAAHGLNIKASYIIVPVALETTGTILVTAEKDPAGGAGKSEVPNPFRGNFQVIADPRLDADSSVKWYGAADANLYDTVEVGFVGGRREPSLESREGWSIDGVEWKVRHEFGVAALEYRTMFYNAGA